MSGGTARPDLTCSGASLAKGDDPAGSAADFSSFLLLTDNEPWARDPAADAARRYLSADAAQYSLEGGTRLRTFAVRSARRTRRATGGLPAFVGRVGGELRRVERLPNGVELARYATDPTADLGEPTAGPLIGVCTNGRRDQCCAVLGRPIARSLAERFGSRINEISHVGGHRYAGTLIVLPSGYLYGFLDPDSAAEVVREAIDGLVHPRHLRGRAGLPPAAQAAEAWWRAQLGSAPPGAVDIKATTLDGAEIRVEAIVDGAASSLRVIRRRVAEVTETRCGGKPFTVSRWEISD